MYAAVRLAKRTGVPASATKGLSLAEARRWLRVLAADPVDAACAQIFADNGHKLVEKKCTQQQVWTGCCRFCLNSEHGQG